MSIGSGGEGGGGREGLGEGGLGLAYVLGGHLGFPIYSLFA